MSNEQSNQSVRRYVCEECFEPLESQSYLSSKDGYEISSSWFWCYNCKSFTTKPLVLPL